MKKPLSKWKKAFIVVVPLALFMYVLSGRIHGTYGSGSCEWANSFRILIHSLESIGGGDVNIAGQSWDSLTLRSIGISASCGPDFQGKNSYIVYHPWRHALGFRYGDEPLKMVYGVTRADIERVADAGGSLEDFVKAP